MPRIHAKHKQGSLKVGDLVEFMGKDKKNRGVGIVMEEIVNTNSYTGALEYTSVKIWWQLLGEEEIVHKGFLRRSLSKDIGIVVKK